MNYRALVRNLADTEWPPGAVLLLDHDDWKGVCEQLAEDPEEPIITVVGAPITRPELELDFDPGLEAREERSAVQIAETERYDRGAYQRVNQVVNERLRPLGTRMDPYHCSSCDSDFLWVSKKPRAWIVCDNCGGQAERTST